MVLLKADSVECLGARVRTLRRQRGLTLKALGRRAGLSHPFLSQLERGLARPSVGSVERIARALDVSVGALWTAPRPAAPRLVRGSNGGATGAFRDLSLPGEPLEVREWSGADPGWPDDADTRGGPTVVYVICGALEVDLDGEVFAVAEGETLHFDGTVPHRFRHAGSAHTRALYVATAC
jgi:transcriptional regulator with XRE-family HTH domain